MLQGAHGTMGYHGCFVPHLVCLWCAFSLYTQELVPWLKGYQQAQCALSSCVLTGTNLNYANLYACHLGGGLGMKCEWHLIQERAVKTKSMVARNSKNVLRLYIGCMMCRRLRHNREANVSTAKTSGISTQWIDGARSTMDDAGSVYSVAGLLLPHHRCNSACDADILKKSRPWHRYEFESARETAWRKELNAVATKVP